MGGQSLAPAVVAPGHSTPAVAYCLTTPLSPVAGAPAAAGSPYECLVPAAAATGVFNVPWTIAVINPVILVTNISEQASEFTTRLSIIPSTQDD